MPSPIIQKKSAEMIMPEPAHHEHTHRQMIIVSIALLGLVVLGGLGYQYIANKKSVEQALRAEFATQDTASAAEFFQAYPSQSMTDAETKSAAEFFKSHPADNQNTAQIKSELDAMAQLGESNYQQWKASRAQ